MPAIPQPSDVLVSLDDKFLVADGEVLPITSWFDEDGDDCEPYDAKACVAGPNAVGQWLTVEILPLDKAPAPLH